MTVIMRCWGPSWLPADDQVDGEYVKVYDPEAHDGRGYIEFTLDLKEAITFASRREAMDFWRTVSVTRPIRPDGKPNRPLTAFSVMIEDLAKVDATQH